MEYRYSKYHIGKPVLFVAIVLALGLAGLVPVRVMAQQVPGFSQYMFSNMFYNPAFAGSNGGICATGLFREQYIGFKDNQGNKVAPETFYVTVDAPIRKLHGGIGGSIMQDKIGFFQNIGVNLGYAYRADLGAGEFSVGAQVLFQNVKLDFSKFTDLAVDPDDDILKGTGDQSDLVIDGSLGIFYQVPEKYYIGLSVTQIAQSKGKNTYYQLRRTYFLTGGYNLVFRSNPKWELKPSAMVMYDGGAFSGNLTALVTYNKKVWGGLGYRYQDAAIILAGMTIKGIRIGMSYDISTSALSSYNSGSVEVMLGYCFKVETEKLRKRYKNTRFL